jgi:hypothetical protein
MEHMGEGEIRRRDGGDKSLLVVAKERDRCGGRRRTW